MPDRQREYKISLGSQNFFQNNIPLFNQLLSYVAADLEQSNYEQLYDLYSGVGTIGITLAHSVKKVIGVEIDPGNVLTTRQNLLANQIANYEVFCGDVAEFSKLFKVEEKKCAVVVVDPPRTGLGSKSVERLLQLSPTKIVYISCNPLTQVQDFALLEGSYKLKSICGFDLFPQTRHMECVAILEKR